MTCVASERHDVVRTHAWVRDGTDRLFRALGTLLDADFGAPSRLPGWSRRHVVAHLARNAEALRRLLTWARTGTPTPMYADATQRIREIESSAQYDVGRLREELVDTAAALDRDVATMTKPQWQAEVRSARGRVIPAAEVPWMRAREVWLHALDLDVGVDIAEVPAGLSYVLVDDVVEFFAAIPDAPAVRISCGDRSWSIGTDGPLVRGEPSYIAAWLTGRSNGEGLSADDLPELPPWL
jgi:maleylpyruvate isomerase